MDQTQKKLTRGPVTMKMRLPGERDYQDVAVNGLILGQFGVARYPDKSGWSVTHLPSGTSVQQRGPIPTMARAVALLLLAHAVSGDTDLLSDPPPTEVREALTAAYRAWERGE